MCKGEGGVGQVQESPGELMNTQSAHPFGSPFESESQRGALWQTNSPVIPVTQPLAQTSVWEPQNFWSLKSLQVPAFNSILGQKEGGSREKLEQFGEH